MKQSSVMLPLAGAALAFFPPLDLVRKLFGLDGALARTPVTKVFGGPYSEETLSRLHL